MLLPESVFASARFEQAIKRFDAENSLDPNRERVDGVELAGEVAYAQRLTSWVKRLCPAAPEALLLAARCQHICRWQIPRASYPMTRPGYLKWRADLKQFHAAKSSEILREVGYGPDIVERVRALNLKQGFPQDPDTRVLEDALCLLFLERQFVPLIGKSEREKMVSAVQKTWKKMTPQAREIALQLPLPPSAVSVVKEALENPQADG